NQDPARPGETGRSTARRSEGCGEVLEKARRSHARTSPSRVRGRCLLVFKGAQSINDPSCRPLDTLTPTYGSCHDGTKSRDQESIVFVLSCLRGYRRNGAYGQSARRDRVRSVAQV